MKLNTGGQNFNLQVGVYANTDPAKLEIEKFITQAEKTSDVKLDIKVNSQGSQAVRTIKTETGDLVTITKQYNETGSKLLSTTVNKLSRGYKNLASETKEVVQSQQELNNIVKHGKSIFQDFTDTFLKMAKFNTINMIYDGLINTMSNAVEITNEFNKATTELRKVSDLEGESLKAYTKELADYGEVVGRTMTEMTDSATIFKRTGATDAEAAQLAQISELYKNVADSEISSAEASSFLVSQMKAFNYTADESIHVIDSVNSVANAFAVSTDDLQTALSKSAAAMATAGNSFEETISLVEAGTAIMQGQAGTVGNGLRTIAINVANLATKSEEFVAANGKVQISLKDENGEIKSTYQVLNELSKSWDKLSRAEQNEIATTLAGKHKYKSLVLLAINLFNCSEYLITL